MTDNDHGGPGSERSGIEAKAELQHGRPSVLQAGSQSDPQSDPNVRSGTGFWSVVQSVGAAMIGVQSSKNRERDFTQGKPIHFIVGGLLGTVLFLLLIWLLVQYLLATS